MYELITHLAIYETTDMGPVDELETTLWAIEYTLTAAQFEEVVELVTTKLQFENLEDINTDLINQFSVV